MVTGKKRFTFIILVVLFALLYLFGKTARMYLRSAGQPEQSSPAGETQTERRNDGPFPVEPGGIEPSNPHTSKATVKVAKVIDGDTLELASGEKVRLIGIDTPEKDQFYYKEAKNRLKKLVEDKDVALEYDVQPADKYGRLLGYVWLTNEKNPEQDVFVNKSMIAEGYANVYTIPPNVKYVEVFVQAQKDARKGSKGLWNEKRPLSDSYVASRNSNVFHRNTCKTIEQISEHNRLIYKTAGEALDEGKSPCRTCRP